MATLLLSAAGAALGAASGVSAFGLSGMVLGRAVGATIGRAIDQRLLSSGSEPVEHGRVDRFRFTGAGEGAPIARLFGRMRIGGQVIWATRFVETATTTGGWQGCAFAAADNHLFLFRQPRRCAVRGGDLSGGAHLGGRG